MSTTTQCSIDEYQRWWIGKLFETLIQLLFVGFHFLRLLLFIGFWVWISYSTSFAIQQCIEAFVDHNGGMVGRRKRIFVIALCLFAGISSREQPDAAVVFTFPKAESFYWRSVDGIISVESTCAWKESLHRRSSGEAIVRYRREQESL